MAGCQLLLRNLLCFPKQMDRRLCTMSPGLHLECICYVETKQEILLHCIHCGRKGTCSLHPCQQKQEPCTTHRQDGCLLKQFTGGGLVPLCLVAVRQLPGHQGEGVRDP